MSLSVKQASQLQKFIVQMGKAQGLPDNVISCMVSNVFQLSKSDYNMYGDEGSYKKLLEMCIYKEVKRLGYPPSLAMCLSSNLKQGYPFQEVLQTCQGLAGTFDFPAKVKGCLKYTEKGPVPLTQATPKKKLARAGLLSIIGGNILPLLLIGGAGLLIFLLMRRGPQIPYPIPYFGR